MPFKRARFPLFILTALTLTVIRGAAVDAQSVEAFYRGKDISLVIYSPAGTAYDLYARLLARTMPRYIPGKPGMIAKNMTGAGGLTATRYLYSSAPKDGTVFGTISRGIPFEPLLGGAQTVDFDPLKFVWLGSMSKETSLAVSWHTSSIKTAADLFTTELMVAGPGAAADATIIPTALNGLVGTKFKIIQGYAGVAAATLSMEQGEIEGIADWSWGAINATRPQWLQEKKLNLLYQGGAQNPNLPTVPMVTTLAKTESDRQAIELIYSREALARPFLLPPGVPADRVKALKNAFSQSLKDKELLADAAKERMEIEYVSGEDVEGLIKRAFATPADVLDRTRTAMGR
jgi:tripartite-type tricarboxylate transporter receptor subunit TctC